MAHKVLIGGTSYTIGGGNTLIGGTKYSIKQGKTLINGTSYTIPFGMTPIYVVNGSHTDYSWTATRGLTYKTGNLQYGAYSRSCIYWVGNGLSAGQTYTISCDTSFNLTKLNEVQIGYLFDPLGGTGNAGGTLSIGSYSRTLEPSTWTTETFHPGNLSANASISFSYRVRTEVDQIIFAISILLLS